MTAPIAPPGLAGLVVTDTTIGDVRGQEGYFHYRGHDATQLARTCSLEEVWHLLAVGHLPDDVEVKAFTERLAGWRDRLPADLLARTRAATRAGAEPLTALRTAWSDAATPLGVRPWLDLDPAQRLDQALGLAAIGPVLVAAGHRDGVAGELADAPTSTAAAYLRLLTGATPPAAHVRALERYLVSTIDHGLNASTFTARVVASTGADLAAVLVAGLGALSGPLHGGAPSRALDMLDAIGTAERAEGWLGDAIGRGERIMGFGHRIYRTEDPRATLLRETARDLGGGRVELALAVEATAKTLLRAHKPDRVLDVNVEYWAAIVLDAVGVPRELFTPTFAVSRAIGWMAHALEQTEGNRIIRPSSRYVGPTPTG